MARKNKIYQIKQKIKSNSYLNRIFWA